MYGEGVIRRNTRTRTIGDIEITAKILERPEIQLRDQKIHVLALHPIPITLKISIHITKVVGIHSPIFPPEQSRTISNPVDRERIRKELTQIRLERSSTSPMCQG